MRISFLSEAIQLSAIIAGRFWKEEAPLENSRKCFTPVPQKDPVATTTQLVFHPLVPAGKTLHYATSYKFVFLILELES